MITKLLQQDWKHPFFIFLAVAVAVYGVWTTTHFVLAYNEQKRVHIFSTSVVASGWEHKENALAQDLSAQAPFGTFTKENSAYIETSASTNLGGTETEQIPSSEEDMVQPGAASPEAGPALDPNTGVNAPGSVPESAGTEAAPAETDSTGQQESTSARPPDAQPPPPESPPPEVQPPPAPPDTSDTSGVQGMTGGILRAAFKHMQTYAAFALLQITPTVSAQATEENTVIDLMSTTTLPITIPTSTPSMSSEQETQVLQNATDTVAEMLVPNNDPTPPAVSPSNPPTIVIDGSDQSDIATCIVLEKGCHTMEFSGFDIDGQIKKKKLQGFELNFSFASLTNEDQITDGKLQVRYFHAGGWRSAGEIYLNKKLSNQTNGGYFTAKLDGLDRWDDLADVHVVFEYISGDGNTSSRLYIDAVWIDGIYKERAQDVLGGGVAPIPTDTSENVSFSLEKGKAVGALFVVLPDGESISFPYLNDPREGELVMRSDKISYAAHIDPVTQAGSDSIAYISITNTGTDEDSFGLFAAFPDDAGTIGGLDQLLHNVATSTEVPVYDDVTYLCESGWQQNASSSEDHTCLVTGESHRCSWINEAGVNCLVNDVLIGTQKQVRYESAWVPVSLSSAPGDGSDLGRPLPAGYQMTAATDQSISILPGQTVYLRVLLRTPQTGTQNFALYARGTSFAGGLDSVALRDEASLQARPAKQANRAARRQANEQVSTKTTFDGDELPQFRFKFKSQRSILSRFANVLRGKSNSYALAHAKLKHVGAPDQDISVDVEYAESGEWTMSFKKQPRTFRPGKYSVELTMDDGGQAVTDTFEFYWGVLAVNTNKTIYEPGENAHLMMASLDDSGNTICDASLALSITDPSGNTQDVPVSPSGKCGPNNVVDIADYLANYTTGRTGVYQVALARLDEAGVVMNRIDDFFEVREDPAYIVERDGPTRIYPKSPYRMDLVVTARRAFSGTITEAVPAGTILSETGGATFSQYDGAVRVSWEVSLRAGETVRLGYTFDAPDVSPYLYVFGPLEMNENGQRVFEELRTWKVASDALGSYVEKNVSWAPTVAGSWEAKDLSGAPYNVPANAVLEIAIVNGDASTARIGGVRHASSSLTRSLNINRAEPQGEGEFTMHVQASATSSIQTYAANTTYISFVLLGYWTSGYYVERFDQIDPGIADNTWGNTNLTSFGVASGTVAEMIVGNWNTGLERNAGVRRSGSSLSRLANIHQSTTAGVNGATMLVVASSSNATIQLFGQVEGANNADVDYWLPGYWSQNPTGLAYTERFDTLAGPTSASTWTNVALDSYGAGAGSIADLLFSNISAVNLSMLIGVRSGGASTDRTFNLHEAVAGGWVIGSAHAVGDSTASSTIQYYSADTASDQFNLIGYWAATNTPPTLTFYNSPFESQKTGSSTPALKFSASDSDGSSDIVYEVQWDDDAVLDDAPLGDRYSSNESGCSPNCFIDLTSGDTSPFTEGDQIRFTIQTSLVSGTTYYWRVRAIDTGGSGLYSDWSTTRSFTYVANTLPAQWMQTQDAQFDLGTLDNVETYGSNSLRLETSAPSEAMIAYAEGTVQTPRYRIWNGSAWGAEASANSVGGTIQWVVVKAASQRNEYILGTQDALSDINVQIYNATSSVWGSVTEVTTTVTTPSDRGFDIAYESLSGNAMIVYCDGDSDPSYRIWNGTSWSAPATITTVSANNCEWIKLASDPTSNEIIVVERDTGAGYEVQVWDGTSAWGNAQTLGSMNQPAHEGIAVEYEESGNQALVAVSNGTAANFRWIAWDGTSWSVSSTQALGDDFEWGVLKRDKGSDSMVLCYVDQDDDIGIMRWDGTAWQYIQELELNAKVGSGGTAESRPLSCEFETTSGRDGYIMVPFSDTTTSNYMYWTGSSTSTKTQISSLGAAWNVGTARTGDGTILSYFHDDINTRYAFSRWNGTAWTPLQVLNNSISVTAEPYAEPVSIAAKVYQPTTGTITSDPIDFSLVTGQSTWGEVLWNATVPAGTDMKMRVMYASGGSCSTLIPDAALAGNSAGFAATSSPINLTGLSTTTYSSICLYATLSSTNSNTPTLDDWTLAWTRSPTLTQEHFRWYVNTTSFTPTDPWPSGGTDVAEDTTISSDEAPSYASVLRLRLSLLVQNVSLSALAQSLTLQYAQGATCGPSLSWNNIGAIGSTTAQWRGYDNSTLSDGTTLSSVLLASSTVAESYEEANDSAQNPNAVAASGQGEWDWVLQHNAIAGTNYCFRAISSDGQTLNTYTVYPSLVTNRASDAPVLSKLFDNEKVASTTPWFEFAATDPEGDDMTYQVQIDSSYSFASPIIDRNSQTDYTMFENIITSSDKDPFNSTEMVRFIPTTALTDGTTYYWRVRAKDRSNSNTWSSWSSIQSFTVGTSVTISTWFQTMLDQFTGDTHDNTEATSTNESILTPPATTGTTTSSAIDYDWKTAGNAWGMLSWNAGTTTGTIMNHVEYWTGSTWALVPEADLSGNAAGFTAGSVSLLGLSPSTYERIRLRANFAIGTSSPRLRDWMVQWGYAVEQPDPTALFDNEKSATTTPTFIFSSTDPQSDDLVYQLSISTTNDFAASTTKSSDLHSGFANTASSTDTSPFVSGNAVSFKVQQADALTNGTTYWWRVRARDPGGANQWSVWSALRSFTIDTTVNVSTWFQTTDSQFNTDTLQGTETSGSDNVRITTTIREAFTAYAEGTVQAPRYRIWNGTVWGSEQTASSMGDTIRFVETAAAPTRDEYAIATQGSTGIVKAQLYNGTSGTTGNVVTISTTNSTTRRGFDIAYETTSGDAIAVACYGTEAVYRVWNGSSWTATSTITLAVTNNCQWIKLVSNPTSDEIILVARDTAAGATDYEALVWSGSAWGNSTTLGSQQTAANESIAAEYEESGNQALVIVSNGASTNFTMKTWSAGAWSAATTTSLGARFSQGRLSRDLGSDNLCLAYIDASLNTGLVRWNGSLWAAPQQVSAANAPSVNNRSATCDFETTSARDGYVMIPYSITTGTNYVYWNGSILSSPSAISTITVSREVRSVRTGDGNILVVAYDDANTDYDFSYWNGSAWSTEELLETTAIASTNPRTIPIDIVARRYPSFTSGEVLGSSIVFTDGLGPKWGTLSFGTTKPGSSNVYFQIEYLTSTSSWALVPDADFPGNSTGTTTMPVNISNLNRLTYNTIRPRANLVCISGDCPTLNDWTVTWSEGITISGTAKAYDQSTNVTSGTVAVAVNGVLQSGKTGTISGGTWSIVNVTAFTNDIITVFVSGAADGNEAIAITKYGSVNDITGMVLYEGHLTLGSDDNPTITNVNISRYDYSASLNNEDIFYEVDAGNDIAVCNISGCSTAELYIKSGTTYRPDSASSGNVTTPNVEIDGTLVADGNTITVNGSWDNDATFTKGSSTVVFSATSTTLSVDSTGASSASFNNLTFGSSVSTARWDLGSALDVTGTLTINYGTLSMNGMRPITLSGDLAIGSNGMYSKGTASTTFNGTGSNTWTDNTSSKQDMGDVIIDGTTKTILLGAAGKATNITIGANDTLSVNNNYALEVIGDWTNNNVFVAQNGTVTFSATSTGRTIAPGSSDFYNLTFNGSGGNWSFSGANVTAGNNFTITLGTVTLPTGTTTVTGNFDTNGGTFMHNNGVVLLNASGAKTVRPGASSFYDLTFNGTGSWSFTDANATSSRHTTITAGTLTAPSGTFAIGGSFARNGGTFTHNSGTLKLTTVSTATVKLGGSDAYNVTFDGVGGQWTFTDTNATTTNNFTLTNGSTTLPSGTLAIGGSFVNSGVFTHNSGTVKFNATATGKSVTTGSSSFYDLTFNSSSGGWTITDHATSTRHTTITNASDFTLTSGKSLAVGGTFTNSVAGSATTWTGSTLYLNSATTYSINTKTSAAEVYGTIKVGLGTDIRMWNSTSTVVLSGATGSLFSQDHAAVDGDLYIFGAYTATTGENWAYATDFDGTALGGSSRKVNVKIASSSVITFTSGTHTLVGGASASTTVSNQGVGAYSFSMTGGTLNAQYYQFRNMDATGVSLSGAPTITSLADGDLELSANGGTTMTIASTVINANPALQIQRVRFATSTGITSGFNVTESGTPTSYWWFRNHYGDLDGEVYDNDPGGDPGYVRWDDSAFSITVSGHVYSDHGSSAIGNPPCDGSSVVTVVVSGGGTYSGSCNAGSGLYTIPNVIFIGDVTLTTYLNTNGGKRAVTVTKTPTADIADMDLYENALILRHENTSSLTIADMATFDSTDDSDVFFTATVGGTNTLTTAPETEVYVWGGKTFAPGGNVTLQSGGSGNARDGRLELGASAVFTEAGTQTLSIGGGLILGSGAVFTPASSVITFTATTTGKSISSASAFTLYDVVFNGSGGGWSLDSAGTATTTVNSLTLTAGTISGIGHMVVQTGGVTGGGTINMTGGTFRFEGTGNFGNSNPWQFKNLMLGNGGSAALTKTGSATTTVTGALTLASGYTLNAGSALWYFTGGGTPLTINGTFTVQTAPFTFVATSSALIYNGTYAALTLAPAGSGSPTYTLRGGTFSTTNLTIGDGTNPVTVTADTNDPSLAVTGNIVINIGATLVASNVGAVDIGGSWTNSGTFTHSNAGVTFNASATGKTITTGGSSFYDLTFNGSSGGWTITDNATSTHDTTITNASSFTLASGKSLAVLGTFTNSVAGGATVWTDSTLFLNSGTSYSLNTKSSAAEVYGTLLIGASSHIRMWNSSAATTSVGSTGSLYSQDHANVDGDLYVWGAYTRSSGSDYWSYATDFDGTDISGTPRQVDVRIATSSTITVSGGLLDIIGVSSATTTIANQGVGAYAFAVSGGTLNASYYFVRNTNSNGLNLSGVPTITSLSRGDFELSVNGGTPLTVAGSVIDANPLKIMQYNRFATSTGVTSGYNVVATGSTGSSWKFNLHYGGLAGEAYDSDPTGDPGYLRWDDSAAQITISGNVYSDEGSTVSTVCDSVTQDIKLVVQGTGVFTTSCNSSTGAYSIPGVSFNPGDTLTLYINGTSTRAATISVDPVSSISNMHLYENRIIVRHEDTAPITIADMIQYDSDQDTDIPFDATDAATDTLITEPNTKFIVWDGKGFAPAGDVTLQSGGSGTSYDGTLEVRASGVFSAASTQSHSIGGSFILGASATFSSGNSTFTFTATTTGKTITPRTSSFYNITFNGSGGNWAFGQTNATSTNNFTITAGTVTLPTGTLEVGGTFDNAGGTFMHNNGILKLTATATGKNIRASGSSFYDLTVNGSGGGWTFLDTTATSTNNFTVTAGSVTLPSTTFIVGGSFLNSGTFTSGSNTVKLTAAASGKSIQAGGSNFYNLTFDGSGGGWTFLDTNATSTNNFTLTNGSTTLPAGTLAVGGSFVNAGVFTHGNGTVKLTATATGKSITTGGSNFYNLTLDSSSGGWTITDNATSTHDTSITNASSFTLTSGKSLAVLGTFTNSVGGGATTWTGTTLFLNSGTSYSLNTKSSAAELYGTLLIGASSHIRMWNASAATTSVDSTGSLYSQDHAAVDGDLYIWGAYTRSSGSDYWSRATDFDGTDISGTPRQVDVRIATSSTITVSGGTLNIVGTAAATSTIANQGSSSYAFTVSGGTLNAAYYHIRNTDSNGLNLSGAPAITSISNGDYELSANGGAMITLAATVIDANASLQSTGIQFATSTGITSGYNVLRTGSPVAAWTFSTHYGNYDGENFDSDGGDGCGSVRWDDSSCLFVSQQHYRWRNDDGGEGALASEWYSASWSTRKKVAITNPNATSYTNHPVQIVVDYVSGMQSDFDDLRFTDSSGTTTLPFWRETTVASASTTVWIKVPSLPASASAVIYMHYGNSGATAADDGSSTFTFFEDFESGSLSAYSGSDVTLFSAGTSFNHNGANGLGASTGNAGAKTTNGGIYRTTASYTGTGKTIRFFQYVDATQQDEPCTLFAVQGSAQNYAVCLDEYPTGQVSIAKNVTSNDGGGTMLASTSVTYSTGWYQVVIDWLSSATRITANVYDAAGTLFATATSSDSTYSSGGVGFSFWGQHGGWDFYSTREYAASAPTYVFGVAQVSGGATWAAAEDTTLTGLYTGQNVRLRFSVQNTGSQITNQQFRLQVASKGSSLSCEAVPHGNFTDVPTTSSGCGSAVACMTASAQFTDQAGTAGLLTYPAAMSFTAGKIIEDPSNQMTSGMVVNGNTATEIEYNFQMTNNATQSNYCFRTTNTTNSGNNYDLDDYQRVAQVTIVHAPQISNFALNNAANITLTEGATTTVSATGTVTDLNGYSDILFATSTIYRSSVAGGALCSADTNSCYQVTSTSCSFSNCSGNSCTISCSANIQYFADPTDVGSTYATSTWLASIAVEDSSGLRDTDTSIGVELLTLRALSITTGGIDFGALANGGNTGAVNAITTTRNTGNVPIDIKVSGTDLTGAGTINVGEQKYATSTFVYGSCSICGLLTGAATSVNVNVSKPTSTSTPVTQDIFFGIGVPTDKPAGSYSGTNYFDAVAPGG